MRESFENRTSLVLIQNWQKILNRPNTLTYCEGKYFPDEK